jgi:hypothetical protein
MKRAFHRNVGRRAQKVKTAGKKGGPGTGRHYGAAVEMIGTRRTDQGLPAH